MFQPSTVAPVARRAPWGLVMCCQIVLLVGCQPGSQHMSWIVSWLLSDCSKLSPGSGASFLKLIRSHRELLPTVLPLFLKMVVWYQYSQKNVVKKIGQEWNPVMRRLLIGMSTDTGYSLSLVTCKHIHTVSLYSQTAGCQTAVIARVRTETKHYRNKHVFSDRQSYLRFTNRFSHMSELHKCSWSIVAVTNILSRSSWICWVDDTFWMMEQLVPELVAD